MLNQIFAILQLIIMNQQIPLSGDDKVLKNVKEILSKDGYEFYNVVSITSIEKPKLTTVIVNTGTVEVALEIDDLGNLISKEKIAR